MNDHKKAIEFLTKAADAVRLIVKAHGPSPALGFAADSIEHATRTLETLPRRIMPCEWREDEDGHWHTGCGEIHEFFEAGPDANGFAHCPYCGEYMKETKFMSSNAQAELPTRRGGQFQRPVRR